MQIYIEKFNTSNSRAPLILREKEFFHRLGRLAQLGCLSWYLPGFQILFQNLYLKVDLVQVALALEEEGVPQLEDAVLLLEGGDQ
jgi:hypothetical protein